MFGCQWFSDRVMQLKDNSYSVVFSRWFLLRKSKLKVYKCLCKWIQDLVLVVTFSHDPKIVPGDPETVIKCCIFFQLLFWSRNVL